MALLNYTTTIDADKTAGEISKMLAKAGAQAVMTEFDPEGNYVSALSFRLKIGDRTGTFRLPSDWRPVQKVLQEQRVKNRRIDPSQSQAVKVAWRIVKDWVEAQLALIETRMVSTEIVFLPYLKVNETQTLAEVVTNDPSFLLPPGRPE